MENLESIGKLNSSDDLLIFSPRPNRSFLSMTLQNPTYLPMKFHTETNKLHFTFNSNFTYNPKHFSNFFPSINPFIYTENAKDLITSSTKFIEKNEILKVLQESSLKSFHENKMTDEEQNHGNLLSSLSNSNPVKRPRSEKPICCSCKRSKCLKLYCECFASGEYCAGCSCVSCYNIEQKESHRKSAISQTLERNPDAFKPKFKEILKEGEIQSVHNKGCHCSKSACKKKYCECFQNGNSCSSSCQCIGCKNQI